MPQSRRAPSITAVSSGGGLEPRWPCRRGAGVSCAFVALLALGLAGCGLIGAHPKLRREGVPATGTILEIWETGTTVNDSPVVGIRLSVAADGLDPWVAETRALVSIVDIPQIQPGAVMCLRYDPQDHARIVLADCAPVEQEPSDG